MGIATIVILCSFAVGITQSHVELKADKPFLSVSLSARAFLKCCYATDEETLTSKWVKSFEDGKKIIGPNVVNLSGHMIVGHLSDSHEHCDTLNFTSVQLNDTGMYQCLLGNNTASHGTYLEVYEPMEKTLNLRESTKDKILMAEGILLLLCVLLPSATVLFKSRKLYELEKKKAKMEEENIYQGLNLEDCGDTYDQIERSQGRGQYQDVCNIMEEEEEIQLEKP